MIGPWPIRPMPRDCEPLVSWVRRIAAEYAMDYQMFCRKALHLTTKQINKLNMEIPNRATAILSVGTGVSEDQIKEMTVPGIIRSIEKLVKQYERQDPLGSYKIKKSMQRDSYAVGQSRRKRRSKPKPRPKPRVPSTETQSHRRTAWSWDYMEDDEFDN